MDFLARENQIPDTYSGKILIKTKEGTYEIIVIINVQSKMSLFDVSIKLDQESLPVIPGKTILFETNIYNLGETKKVDADIEYSIKDLEGNLIFQEKETVAIETSLEKIKKTKLPSDLPMGQYMLGIKVE